MNRLVSVAKLHVLNMHNPLTKHQKESILDFQKHVEAYLDKAIKIMNKSTSEDDHLDKRIKKIVNDCVRSQVQGLASSDHYNLKNSETYFHVFFDTLESVLLIRQMTLMTIE
jgi:hypothetical protein